MRLCVAAVDGAQATCWSSAAVQWMRMRALEVLARGGWCRGRCRGWSCGRFWSRLALPLPFSFFSLGLTTSSRSMVILTTFFFGVMFTRSTALVGSS